MFYSRFLRPLLFALPPETAHSLGLRAARLGLFSAPHPPESLKSECFGLSFPSPIGLAAGFDKNAEAIAGLHKMGFSFVEVGTCTPRPQTGNDKPRLFRLVEDEAIINRLGFNNKGADAFVKNLVAYTGGGMVGANIGKNKTTEEALTDYADMLGRVLGRADYVTVNISSPNTKGLRDLQGKESLVSLLKPLLAIRDEHAAKIGIKTPLLVKIAPDLSAGQQEDIAALAQELKLDGLIVSNTTISRPSTLQSLEKQREGGLSGRPLFELSTEVLANIYRLTSGTIPLIGVGGIASGEDAYRKIRAGASLVQFYSVLIYQGPGVVARMQCELAECLERDGFNYVQQAIGADHA